MSQQTTVNARMTIAFAGMLADSDRVVHCDSRFNEEASNEIAFGTAVVRGTTNKDNGALRPHTSAAAAAPLFAGIVVHSHDYARDVELGTTGLKPKVTMQVLQQGRIYVLPEESVAPGDAVRFRAIAGAGTVGAFRKTADAGNSVDISKFARWITTGSTTVPAVLEIDMAGAKDATAD